MAMEQFLQESVPQNINKEDNSSLNKWKSTNESIDEPENNPSSSFDCNICLDTVHDPVVTLCGHLYCWPCIYKWIHHQQTENTVNETAHCPVCKTEVSQKTIVPLYGRGQTTETKFENKDGNVGNVGIKVPRRPSSPRGSVITSGLFANPNSVSFINPNSPITSVLGEIVNERIFGYSHSGLIAYPNSYSRVARSTQRARRQEIQADQSLSRISFFLLCCVISCLLLF